jgi:hypothetical protein
MIFKDGRGQSFSHYGDLNAGVPFLKRLKARRHQYGVADRAQSNQ